MIKFKLYPLDKVSLFQTKENYTAHWFALTDGEYWIELGEKTLYE